MGFSNDKVVRIRINFAEKSPQQKKTHTHTEKSPIKGFLGVRRLKTFRVLQTQVVSNLVVCNFHAQALFSALFAFFTPFCSPLRSFFFEKSATKITPIVIASDFCVDAKSPRNPCRKKGKTGSEIATRNSLQRKSLATFHRTLKSQCRSGWVLVLLSGTAQIAATVNLWGR